MTTAHRWQLRVLLPLACSGLLVLAAPAWADIGRDAAAGIAQRMTNGRVLSVDRSDSGRQPVWRVKIVTAQGEVRVILIDAATGRPL